MHLENAFKAGFDGDLLTSTKLGSSEHMRSGSVDPMLFSANLLDNPDFDGRM